MQWLTWRTAQSLKSLFKLPCRVGHSLRLSIAWTPADRLGAACVALAQSRPMLVGEAAVPLQEARKAKHDWVVQSFKDDIMAVPPSSFSIS
mmetsp:Transcript_75224/g.243233  ORF Transcript_75224/g.243233 Transcript_75224/m.243233 type:complete len:91 (-) Transcript_75224:99-371(-)